MNTYECQKKYFHTENGRQHLKEAQKKYRQTDKGKEYNRMIALRWYYIQKEYKNEVKQLMAIQIY